MTRLPLAAALLCLLPSIGWGQSYWTSHAKLNGYWAMQDNAATTTVVGTVGGNGTLSSSTTAAKRVAGPNSWLPYGLDFNADSYISTTLAAPTGSAVRTFVGWVKSDTTAEDRKYISSGNSASGSGGGFDFTVETGVRFRHGSGNITYGTVNTSWHHVASVVPVGATTTDNIIVYIDGVATSGSRTGGSNQTLNTTASNWYIATRASSPGADLFNGSVAGFGVANVALSASEIAELIAGPEPTLTSGSITIDASGLTADTTSYNGYSNGTLSYDWRWEHYVASQWDDTGYDDPDVGPAEFSPTPATPGRDYRLIKIATNSGGSLETASNTYTYTASTSKLRKAQHHAAARRRAG